MHHDQIMESYTPLNNYLNNCVIKLHIKLQYHWKRDRGAKDGDFIDNFIMISNFILDLIFEN
jgi:hypothetical protein